MFSISQLILFALIFLLSLLTGYIYLFTFRRNKTRGSEYNVIKFFTVLLFIIFLSAETLYSVYLVRFYYSYGADAYILMIFALITIMIPAAGFVMINLKPLLKAGKGKTVTAITEEYDAGSIVPVKTEQVMTEQSEFEPDKSGIVQEKKITDKNLIAQERINTENEQKDKSEPDITVSAADANALKTKEAEKPGTVKHKPRKTAGKTAGKTKKRQNKNTPAKKSKKKR